MVRLSAALVFSCLSLVLLAEARGADPWKGASVMPKSATLQYRPPMGPDRPTPERSVYQIVWPAKVASTDSRWARLSDQGGYSPTPDVGWVRMDDLLILDTDAPTSDGPAATYSDKIANPASPADCAFYHWLRGIYWENRKEYGLAAKDYMAALSNPLLGPQMVVFIEPTSPIHAGPPGNDGTGSPLVPPFQHAGDAYRRWGVSVSAEKNTAKKEKALWLGCFVQAEQYLCSSQRARLYDDWGNAYKNTDDANDSAYALGRYCEAIACNPSWSAPYFAKGQLLAHLATKAVCSAVQEQKLSCAVEQYEEVIRTDASSADAFRERAESLRLSARVKDVGLATSNDTPTSDPEINPILDAENASLEEFFKPRAPALGGFLDRLQTLLPNEFRQFLRQMVAGDGREMTTRQGDILQKAQDSADRAGGLTRYRNVQTLLVLAKIHADLAMTQDSASAKQQGLRQAVADLDDAIQYSRDSKSSITAHTLRRYYCQHLPSDCGCITDEPDCSPRTAASQLPCKCKGGEKPGKQPPAPQNEDTGRSRSNKIGATHSLPLLPYANFRKY